MAKDLDYTVKKVTPAAMRTLMQNGMLVGTGGNITDLLLRVSVHEETFHKVADAVFTHDFSNVKLEEVDLVEVSKGVQSFLAGYLNPSS